MLTIKDSLLMHFPLSGLQLEEWETKKRAHLSDLPKHLSLVKNQTIEFLISEVSMMTFVIIIIIIIITIIIATFL